MGIYLLMFYIYFNGLLKGGWAQVEHASLLFSRNCFFFYISINHSLEPTTCPLGQGQLSNQLPPRVIPHSTPALGLSPFHHHNRPRDSSYSRIQTSFAGPSCHFRPEARFDLIRRRDIIVISWSTRVFSFSFRMSSSVPASTKIWIFPIPKLFSHL